VTFHQPERLDADMYADDPCGGRHCRGCTTCEDERACEGCDTWVGALDGEQADDGVWLCRDCADAAHREQEAREYRGPVHEAEGWK